MAENSTVRWAKAEWRSMCVLYRSLLYCRSVGMLACHASLGPQPNLKKRGSPPSQELQALCGRTLQQNSPKHSKMHEEHTHTQKPTTKNLLKALILPISSQRFSLEVIWGKFCLVKAPILCLNWGMEMALFFDPCLLHCPVLHAGSFSTILPTSLFIFCGLELCLCALC